MMNTIATELKWTPNPYTALVVFVSTPTLSDGAYGAGWSYQRHQLERSSCRSRRP